MYLSYFLTPKLQASSHVLYYSSVSVSWTSGETHKTRFSRHGSLVCHCPSASLGYHCPTNHKHTMTERVKEIFEESLYELESSFDLVN